MQLFGRDQINLDAIAAEFLPDGKQLFIIAADGDGTLHVLQYDPENPKSERGTKLLHRSTFHSGAFPSTMTLLPRTTVSSERAISAPAHGADIAAGLATQQVLVTTQEGGLALITPLSEQSYRRLSTLQNILIANLEHPCGLNPRAYRAVEIDGIGGRAIIDGNVVQKWLDQSSQHKSSTADKCGGTVWDVRGDLEVIGGGGLGYL
jgi:cleavage and polyadenylation specificity factor subunit 1